MANKLSKKDIAKAVSLDMGVSLEHGNNFVDCLFKKIAAEMKAGNEVSIYGFGTFSKVERSARQGINPKTMEKISIAAKGAPKFKPAKTLKEVLA